MWSPRPANLSLRLPMLFGLLTVIPAVALGWLTLELVQKDRELEKERLREQAADRIVAASHQRLADLELLFSATATLPPDVARVTVVDGRITADPPDALAYYPDVAQVDEASAVFTEGERFEYRDRDAAKAVRWFARLAAETTDPNIQGGALLRLARNQGKTGNIDAALATYDRLAALDAQVEGVSAALLALVGRCTVLDSARRAGELKATAELLLAGLSAGRWRPGRTVYESFVADARRWSGDTQAMGTGERERAAAAFERTFDHWTTERSVPPRGLSIIEGGPVLTAGDGDAGRLTVLVAGPAFLRDAWRGVQGVDVLLSDADGVPIFGAVPTRAQAALRTPDVSGLPWTVRVAGDGIEPAGGGAIVRRQLRLWGLGMVLLLIGGSAYVTWRGVSRELAVVRLQTDFVAAVSHEFRTPLASLRHLSDMLAKRRISGDEQRQQCYDHLVRESERLERLVEELLDFGRLEEGQYQFRFEPVDVSALVRDVSSRFQEHAGARGHGVEVSCGDAAVMSMIDRDALTRALWNLLDNAAKYSPDSDTIWVQLSVDHGAAVIRVRDQGVGIDAGEQQQIFRKFVRGSRARDVTGTGLGLTMVRHIVDAHGGDISVESEPDKGSTFALRLPLGAAA